jgi:hypothetical protein
MQMRHIIHTPIERSEKRSRSMRHIAALLLMLSLLAAVFVLKFWMHFPHGGLQ